MHERVTDGCVTCDGVTKHEINLLRGVIRRHPILLLNMCIEMIYVSAYIFDLNKGVMIHKYAVL